MSKANERRQKRRVAQKIEHGHRPSAAAFKKYVKGAPTVSVTLDSASLPAAAGGYGANSARKTANTRKAYSKDDLVEKHGFTPLGWNGMCAKTFALLRIFDRTFFSETRSSSPTRRIAFAWL